MNNDILQFAIDVRNPIDEKIIREALESYEIEVIGIDWRASWHDGDYWKCKPPYCCD